MPKGLYGRAALILVLPIAVLQIVLAIVFVQRNFEGVTDQMMRSAALELSYLSTLADEAPDLEAAQARIAPVADALAIDWELPGEEMRGYRRVFYDISGRVVILRLEEALPNLRAVDLASSLRRVTLQTETPHGPLTLQFDRRRAAPSNPHQLLVLMGILAIVMTGIAFLYLRGQLRPITRLSAAAEAFGRGRVVPYKPSGATEVRAAGHAFLDMRSRIERQIEQRTLMLSGVSHDLRTPLTRLRLGLSMLTDEPEAEDMLNDIAEMEAMLGTFLDFARGEALDDPQEVSPAGLALSAVENGQRAGGTVSLGRVPPDEVQVTLRPLAVERALANLVGNAIRYAGKAEVSVQLGERAVVFTVEDDGPGIPEDSREIALRPFARLDTARNQDRGSGVGLGLSIAFDIARGHGGTLRLGESERWGGLRADLVLPL
ncbi:ATP-binding protein [Roseicyclus sp. F158]|uniref:histidine kinase n=1 Tax=Tropicimonas omnivorans TaxID=3075590 RepID=A0ABU3DHC9_9RHOB|nr:ATP-binding protein [Roseicyclus sp. F158]MDT0683118.1 ATP-binding protein [Roseicyclus sp. F158]